MISKFSIAVLPFHHSGKGKEENFLSDGLSLEVIHALSNYEFLLVTSRYSSAMFSNKQTDIRNIRNKLKVAWLVEGSFRINDDVITLMSQLVETGEGHVVKSISLKERMENLAELAQKTASSLALFIERRTEEFQSDKKIKAGCSKAIEEYMKGQHLLNQLNNQVVEQMLDHFHRSLEIDPEYARPMVALCHSYSWLASVGLMDPMKAHKEIESYINRLFELDYLISDVYQLQAEKLFWLEWKPVQALEKLNTALELNNSNSAARVMKGLALASIGKVEEALESLFMSERLNPYGENVKYCIGMIYRYTGDFDKANAYLQESIGISSSWLAPYFTMIEVLCLQKRFEDLSLFIEKSKSVKGFVNMLPIFKGLAAATAGRKREALEIIESIRKMFPENEIPPVYYYLIAMTFLQLEMKKEAMDWMETGLSFRSSPFIFLHIDCTWDQLKNEARLIDLKNLSGLPDASAEKSPVKYRKAQLDPSLADKISQTLQSVMTDEKLYLEPKLNMSDLAESCEVTVNQLSQYINSNLGKSFFEYINRFRLDYFLDISNKKEFKNLSILGLAYESGFNSKTTFNTFFKKELNITPREYLRRGDLERG